MKPEEKKDKKTIDFLKTMGARRPSMVTFFIFIFLYVVTMAFVIITSRSDDMIRFMGTEMHLTSLAGILSSIANTILIFLVVFFNKLGFIVSLVLTVMQFPTQVLAVFRQHNGNSIPGIFGGLFTIIAIVLIFRRNRSIDKYRSMEVSFLKEQQRLSKRLFEQTATALVNAIDAKDTYSRGHSMRVAEYSLKIAKMMGKDEEECEKIYYAALLHDVGKIGIDDSIINKKGRLNAEEYDIIKQHPNMGNQILSSISEHPFLSIGAHFHHERYDGKGYPEGLKGEEIPEIARIISVADAYDAMTSNRSYRNAIPQQIVREEIVKGAGSQFDPEIARIMQNFIDIDTGYKMKERIAAMEISGRSGLSCDAYRSRVSDGIIVTPYLKKISLKYTAVNREKGDKGAPVIILFDSLDGRYHEREKEIRELLYFEYAEIPFDGEAKLSGARKLQTAVHESRDKKTDGDREAFYEIEAVKYRDHALLRIDDGVILKEITIALPDSSRYVYIGFTGEKCRITDINVTKTGSLIDEDYITRIAEKISFIDDAPVGDLPNLQVDGHRTASTDGIPVTDGLKISFHTQSLPTARLLWHCPYICLFTSEDKKVDGENFREYALVCLDGENWDVDSAEKNELIVRKDDAFEGWDKWKKRNREGIDCVLRFERSNDHITLTTENLGLFVQNTTTIPDGKQEICVSLSGDQCALTDIRISRS